VGSSELKVKRRKLIGIEGNGERNTLPEIKLLADANVYILDVKYALKVAETRGKGFFFCTNR
jgi:hypothetical protein